MGRASTQVGPAYSFRASFAFGRSSLLPHFRRRVARIAFRAQKFMQISLTAHEHLYVFRKPAEDERLSPYRHSVKWWQ